MHDLRDVLLRASANAAACRDALIDVKLLEAYTDDVDRRRSKSKKPKMEPIPEEDNKISNDEIKVLALPNVGEQLYVMKKSDFEFLIANQKKAGSD